ncbi:transcription antitermination factor NusA-like protein [Salibacterium salarium]|nr:sulfotransferase [Salibacterium salarium]MDQ0297879.1 transcription antitermination factor NusA-like protein [Salibacterium salarium]
MNKNTPNLFIVGAQKSATTSLYNYLKEHPNIFFSSEKEPNYFTTFFDTFPHNGPYDKRYDKNVIGSAEEYYKLFSNYSGQKYIAESSVHYLYFNGLAYKLKEESPDAKIIISLRNPIERAYSAYTYYVSRGRESESFREAIQNENHRMLNNYEVGWYYIAQGLYYQKVKDYLEVFGRENVHIVLFDEIKDDLEGTLKNIYKFLEVDPVTINNTEKKYNVSGTPKNKITKVIASPLKAKSLAKKYLPTPMANKLKDYYFKILEKNLAKTELSVSDKEYLKSVYETDIKKLSVLIEKDLNHWLE